MYGIKVRYIVFILLLLVDNPSHPQGWWWVAMLYYDINLRTVDPSPTMWEVLNELFF